MGWTAVCILVALAPAAQKAPAGASIAAIVAQLNRAVARHDEKGYHDAANQLTAVAGGQLDEVVEAVVRESQPPPRPPHPAASWLKRESGRDDLMDALYWACLRQGKPAVERLVNTFASDQRARHMNLEAVLNSAVIERIVPVSFVEDLATRQDRMGEVARSSLRYAQYSPALTSEPLPLAFGELGTTLLKGCVPEHEYRAGLADELPWSRSPYNPAEWDIRASSECPGHPARAAADRDTSTFWAASPSDPRPVLVLRFPRPLLIIGFESSVCVVPGARSSEDEFARWPRPTMLRVVFDDGTVADTIIDYSGSDRHAVAWGPLVGDRQSEFHTRQAALIWRFPLRWQRSVRSLRLTIAKWEPIDPTRGPALAEIAIADNENIGDGFNEVALD